MGPRDRIRETGLLEDWEHNVALIGSLGAARVEIELWYRGAGNRQTAAQAAVEQVIAAAGGQTVRTSIIPEIQFYGVLADIPYDQVQAVLDGGPEAIELLTAESVMFVTPARPMAVPAPRPTAFGLPNSAKSQPKAPTHRAARRLAPRQPRRPPRAACDRPGKALAHATEDGVEATVSETDAVGVVEDALATVRPGPCVHFECLEERHRDGDLALLLELLVEHDRRCRMEIGSPEVEDALAAARRLPGERKDEEIQLGIAAGGQDRIEGASRLLRR